MNNRIKIFFLFLMYSAISCAEVGIDVFLHHQAVLPDTQINFYLSGFNNASASEIVDVHVVIMTDDGTIYEYPDWNTNFVPWLSSFTLPNNFQLSPTLLGDFNSFPEGFQKGKVYKIFVALSKPGTLDLMALESHSFTVINDTDNWIAGGLSLGYGESPAQSSSVLAASGGYHRYNYAPGAEDLYSKINVLQPDIEQCQYNTIVWGSSLSHYVGQDNIVSDADAGPVLTLSSANAGNLSLNRSISGDGSISYFNGNINQAFYVDNDLYTVNGIGGVDVPAFSVSVTAPRILNVAEPELSTLQTIDSSNDLKLTWNGNNGIGEVIVDINAAGTNPERGQVLCRFADDGEAVIPSSLLKQLQMKIESNSSTNDEISIPGGIVVPGIVLDHNAQMIISRERIELNEKGGIVSTFYMGRVASITVNVQ